MRRKNKEKQQEQEQKIVGKVKVQKREVSSESSSLDTEREKLRKRNQRRTKVSVVFVVILVMILGGLGVVTVKNLTDMANETEEVVVVKEVFQPTVEILDENGTNTISERTREFVGQLEVDLKDFGVKMTRAVLPMGKMREVDVNVEGVSPYFKVNIDRGTGVSAEDIVKMVKYLKQNELVDKISYVDVRVEGKAFYK